MSQQQPDPIKESLAASLPEPAPAKSATAPLSVDNYEQEWVPGDQLQLLRIPPPTVWPATVALGITGIAFGVVTHWILSMAGLFLFLLGANGWIEDLKKDVL